LYLLRLCVGCAVMGGGLWWAGHRLDWLGADSLRRAAWMAGVLAAAAVLYFGTLAATGLKLREFARRG
jgi:putative peptidoglycan lipid II flippase